MSNQSKTSGAAVKPVDFEQVASDEKHPAMKQWLILQAQLQQNYASPKKAITLLELVEAVYGEEVGTGLMLCQAWSTVGELEPLERKVEFLLAHGELSCEQRAAVYYCLSVARWKAGQKVEARKAHRLYLSLIAKEDIKRHEKLSTES